MKHFPDALQSIALTLWIGAVWSVGLIVAPMLFRVVERAHAGVLAGQFFAVVNYVGLGCGAYLLLFRLARFGGQAFAQLFFWSALAMVALTGASQFGVQPILAGIKQQALPMEVMQSILRDRFAAWHGVSSVLYLIECVLGLMMVVQHGRGR